NVKVNYERYRLLQICAVYVGLMLGKYGAKTAVSILRSRMTLREQIFYGVPLSILVAVTLIVPKRYHAFIVGRINLVTGSHPRFFSPQFKGKFITILDVFENIKPVSDFVKKAEGI
ncbi:MAG: hypothetical protein V3V40_03140, partial [Nitrosomonadaceae bacterium]